MFENGKTIGFIHVSDGNSISNCLNNTIDTSEGISDGIIAITSKRKLKSQENFLLGK